MKNVTLALLLAVMIPLAAGANAATGAEVSTIQRAFEPVVVTGGDIGALDGLTVDKLFVYAYTAGGWVQIPAQVDEVAADGSFVGVEDGILDNDDQLAFMASDLGSLAPLGSAPSPLLAPGSDYYQLEIRDPLDPSARGYVYVVWSAALTKTFVADYAGFDGATHRLTGSTYKLGFATPRPWADYLTLGSSTTDILDRNKLRLFCSLAVWCPITEESTPNLTDGVIKDGPVRAIIRGGRALGYASLVTWETSVTLPPTLSGDIRLSFDFNGNAMGSTVYNAAVPAGVTVDGAPDVVPPTPVSNWFQLSTASGTLVQVSDNTTVGGTQTNYYLDSSGTDNSDTGDKQHWGETGLAVASPNLTFNYKLALYMIPGKQANVGAAYAAFRANPLTVVESIRTTPPASKVYMPLFLKLH